MNSSDVKPGLELDRRIAEAIGWTEVQLIGERGDDYYAYNYGFLPGIKYGGQFRETVPLYSSSEETTTRLIENLIDQGVLSDIRVERSTTTTWLVTLWSGKTMVKGGAQHPKQNLARCLALIDFFENLKEGNRDDR